MSHQEDQALLKAYIAEWRKFFTQCNYLPTPFRQLETSLMGFKTGGLGKGPNAEASIVRKVYYLCYIFILCISIHCIDIVIIEI